ncbi:hypothetical protein SteCoe_28189 [Stentor coeruleus]|uniref:Uncharacterized protein n=1 Tax=Stentor coeruleus TaxID=5963 RepID=A0A1R2B8R9_9CILI|nr:hypothetical protein SteCoe_28189 [Stentor coeruleus]
MAVLLLLLSSALAKLTVIEPPDLKEKFSEREPGIIPSSLANFGNPPYGSHIIGRVYTYRSDQNITGCLPLPPLNFESNSGVTNNPILILDRGNCSFVVKVRNAQSIGASAVIIANNREGDPEHIMMIDDGTAGNIYIPSMLISKDNGIKLKSYVLIHPNNKVRVQMAFEMPNPDNRVEYEMWMSSEHDALREFLADYSKHAQKLIPDTLMSPHYVLWYSIERSKEGFINEHKDCISGGRYCAPDPDLDSGPRTGREIVIENLRQLCLHKYLTEKKNVGLWWDYIAEFKNCKGTDFNAKCSDKVLSKIGVKSSIIEKCIEESVIESGKGKDININDNKLLREERDAMIERGIFFYPALIINNVTFRGDLETVEVMTAICAGFKDQPKYCLNYFNVISEEEFEEDDGRVSPGTVILIIVFSLIVLLIVLFFYRKWLRRNMNQRMKSEISKAVNQYIALTDQSVNKSKGFS